MPAKKLTKEAIIFIINKRNDKSTNYTFDDIAKAVLEKYDIDVTGQAVGKSYRKNKDNEEFKTGDDILSVKPKDEVKLKNPKQVKPVLDQPKKPKPKPKSEPIIPKVDGSDFDEDAGANFDPDDFFKK